MAGTHVDAKAVEQKLKEAGELRVQCQQNMFNHFLEVSRQMPSEQGKRYLQWVQERTLTPGEELVYLKEFKKRNRLPYGFVVADSDANNINYGAYSIPMSFLIDRRGAVRFISVGADPDEIMALEKMIKKLIAEPAEVKTESQNR